MIKEITATGKDVAEAQANARQLLGAGENVEVNYEIIYLGRKGFMGFGSKPAQVKAYIEIPDKEAMGLETVADAIRVIEKYMD